MPGESLFSSWGNFIFLIALFILGIVLYRIIASIIYNHKKANQNLSKKIEQTTNIPHSLKVILKIVGTVIYIGVCVLIIALSSS
jgi:lysylphosphatidylglycerol synthetase-like protein (DUF2156 family)